MKISKKTLFITGLALLLVIGLAMWMLVRKDSITRQEPVRTINVFGSRAISPCQALPESSVSKIYGTLGPKSYIDERFYDSSLDTKQAEALGSSSPNSVKCIYMLDDTENSTVSVEFEQFATDKDAQDEWKQAASYSKADSNKLLDELDASIPGAEVYNLDPEKLKAASESLRKAVNAIDDSEESQVLAGTSGAILYSPTRNGFLGISGNSIITVGYQFGSNDFFDDERQVAPGEVAGVADKIQSTFDVILSNISNPKLSQAPSPALRNTTGKIGETKIFDACKVLSDDIFFTTLSVDTLSPRVEKVSIRKNISANSEKPITPSNSCLKRTTGTTTEGYADLQIQYSPNQEIASEYFKIRLKERGSSRVPSLPTDATETRYGERTLDTTLVQFILFQYKSYTGYLSIARTNDSGEHTRISEEKLRVITNKIVDRLSSLSK